MQIPLRTRPLALLLALAAPIVTVASSLAPSAGESVVAESRSDDDEVDYEADVDFALDALEERCGHFFELKDIDWKKVRKQFAKEAKDVETDQEHLVLLVRLLARLEDGHAQVRPLAAGEDVRWPEEPERAGPGMFWCRVGKKIYVKNAWSTAADLGIGPGWEVRKVEKRKVGDWLEERVEELTDVRSFSTDQQAFFYACHWGLAMPVGTRLDLELKNEDGKTKRRTIVYDNASYVPNGPAFPPAGLTREGDIYFGRTADGFGYVHVRRCRSALPEQMDVALAQLADVPGMILDFRGNSGGGFDHDALMGRFVPKGETLAFVKRYASAGPTPYAGPVVVIVDATVRSAGETASGGFKEDGRAYMIGESNTAGMSSSKTTVELPSGLFALYVSIASNKGRFNDGRGLEGIGAVPHEYVEFDPDDLVEERDTLILRAAELLADGDLDGVPYQPED